MNLKPNWRLVGTPKLDFRFAKMVETDFDRFSREPLPANLADYLATTYRVSLETEFVGRRLRIPFGKASGQLSLRADQVKEDTEAGLGFVVLKTLIASDSANGQSMSAWVTRDAKMDVTKVVGQSGRTGWTVDWKGRGWWLGLPAYLDLFRKSLEVAGNSGLVVIPSCKFHLPNAQESDWRVEEYKHTTQQLLQTYKDAGGLLPMPLEKDFSPTLFGPGFSTNPKTVADWLATVPRLLHQHFGDEVRLGMKLPNTTFEDAFQVDMLRTVFSQEKSSRPQYVVYANRLFDFERRLGADVGIAKGGPDLSDRNLAVLDEYWRQVEAGAAPAPTTDLSATGDIHSGRIALEYALRGCTTFQMHTFFQLPNDQYATNQGTRASRALHSLLFDPYDGFLVWLRCLAEKSEKIAADGSICFQDVVRKANA